MYLKMWVKWSHWESARVRDKIICAQVRCKIKLTNLDSYFDSYR